MKIDNVKIYGLNESLVASGLPMLSAADDTSREIDKNDIKRGLTLSNVPLGSGHDNFLNGVVAQFDLTATNKFWTQMQRYHFVDFVSAMSTMHRMKSMNIKEQLDISVDPIIVDRLVELQKEFNKNPKDKNAWLALMMSTPSGLNITARLTTNYRQLRTIYAQRRNHRLPEWQIFCDWIETLENAEWIIGKD